MRLLIYLLALISGFSAADAARAELAPASSVAQAAVAAAEALASQEQINFAQPVNHWSPRRAFVAAPIPLIKVPVSTPISRQDKSHQ
jgi:predicted RNA polymerase sigma factor